MSDYDELADRASDNVPEHLTEQRQIRDYLESDYQLDQGGKVDRTDKLYDEVSRRIAHSREGVEASDTGERKFYDPATGRWKDDGGLFSSDPFER